MSEAKNFLGLTVLPAAILCGVLAATVSRGLRALFFFLLIVLTVTTQHLDVNFVSREWYRGTTRGFEFSTVDILSLSVLFSSLLRPNPGAQRWYWPPSLGFILVFFVYCLFSVCISDPQLFGFFELSKMLRGIAVFVASALFVQAERQLRVLVFGLICAVWWQGLQALYQRYHDGSFRVTGVIGDPNSLSMYLCMLAPVCVAASTADFPKPLKAMAAAGVLLGVVGVVLSISRTGVATIAAVTIGTSVACASFKLTGKRVVIALAALAIGIGIAAKSWHTVQMRYQEVTLDEELHGHGQGRGYYLRLAKAIAADRFFGVGLNNWSYWVSNDYGPRQGFNFVPYIGTEHWPSDVVPSGRDNLDAAQAAPAHNLGALTLGELGPPGLFLFALIWTRWFQMGVSFLRRRSPDPMHRLGTGFFFACCGVFLQSLTEWVYRQTQIFFTLNLILGALASLYCLKRLRRRQAQEEHSWNETELGPAQLSDMAAEEG